MSINTNAFDQKKNSKGGGSGSRSLCNFLPRKRLLRKLPHVAADLAVVAGRDSSRIAWRKKNGRDTSRENHLLSWDSQKKEREESTQLPVLNVPGDCGSTHWQQPFGVPP